MPRAKGQKNPKKLNWYGLGPLGYTHQFPVTGDWTSDQLGIEMVCFRIGHRRREGGLGKFGHFKNIVDLCWNNEEMPSLKRCIWNKWSEKQARELCRRDELGIAGSSSSGKSDMGALWAVVNYIVDPTHTKVLIMSTTIKGAKDKIWKTLREYLDALPSYPGKPLWSTNQLLGSNYMEDGYGDSSGIYLLAGEKAKEKESLEKLLGIKAPRTGDLDGSFEGLCAVPAFADLVAEREEEELRDLLPRLANMLPGRPGKIIFEIDEATGVVDSVYNAYRTNLKPGNPGHIQLVMMANPNLHWDVFGRFCRPAVGWENVTIRDEEWETTSGGLCIRLNGEKNPRITEKNEKLSWMLTQEELDDMAKYGKTSLYYYRFVLAFWCPQGADFGVYSQSDIENTGAMEKAVWGFGKPVMHSSLDPVFSTGGDKPACTFFLYGEDTLGRSIMEIVEQVPVQIDVGDTDTDVSYQLVREWRRQCEKRGILPQNAAFDATGGGVPFAGIVRHEWSAKVQGISSGGKPSNRKVGSERNSDGSALLANQRFGTKATEMWFAAHPFLRSGQIKGISTELAKEICSRKLSDRSTGLGNKVNVEDKRIYKKRELHSPDDADSFFVGLEHLRTRHGFKAQDFAADAPPQEAGRPGGPWEAFKRRARKLTTKTNLQR